jgi:hypothetical protein
MVIVWKGNMFPPSAGVKAGQMMIIDEDNLVDHLWGDEIRRRAIRVSSTYYLVKDHLPR